MDASTHSMLPHVLGQRPEKRKRNRVHQEHARKIQMLDKEQPKEPQASSHNKDAHFRVGLPNALWHCALQFCVRQVLQRVYFLRLVGCVE